MCNRLHIYISKNICYNKARNKEGRTSQRLEKVKQNENTGTNY